MAILRETGDAKPQFGRRLLPTLVDQMARTQPDREMMSVMRSTKASDGWRPITFSHFASAVNRTAAMLIQRHPKAQPQTRSTAPADPTLHASEHPRRFPTLAFIGPNDLRYLVFLLACVKAGCKALFISPRNSLEAQLNLFDKTACDALYHDASFRDRARPWIEGRPGMQGFEVSSVEEWLGDSSAPPAPAVPYERTFEEARWDPLVVLHTSGTTGLPKPVVVRAGQFALIDYTQVVPEFRGRQSMMWDSMKSRRLFSSMPLFHAAALTITLTCTIYFGIPCALSPADRMFTPQVFMEAIEYADITMSTCPPAILEEMSHMPEGIAALSKLDRVVFGGGPLSDDAGNALAKGGVNITSVIAATEIIPLYYYLPADSSLWGWFLIDSQSMGIDWQPFTDSDEGTLYEQVIIRKEKDPGDQAPFYIFPEATEYSTKDLYIKHPSIPDLWKYRGRADDVMVFSNGEKLNPVTIESAISSLPGVKGALVVGQGRFQAALLIEPAGDGAPATEEEREALVERVWPAVERVNKETVAHGRIVRQLVTVTRPDKPFPRAGKGTIQRHAAVKMYADEIAALYDKAAGDLGSADVNDNALNDFVPDVSSEEALARSMVTLFSLAAGLEERGKALDVETDIYAAGVDSLQTISSSRILRKGLEAATGQRIAADAVATRFIYANPTPKQLASYLMREVIGQQGKENGHVNGAGSRTNGVDPSIETMQALLEKYTQDLPDAAGQKQKPAARSQGQTVVVTGTTGGLGSYLLDMLQASPSVAKVVCLNRTEDAGERQARSSAARGLDTTFAKAEFLRADLAEPRLGLSAGVYGRLLAEADRVVHNAWPVNFNVSVATLEPQVRGVRHLVDFSAACARRVPVALVSSIGTVQGWPGPAAVPERQLADLAAPGGGGYGQSKLVASLVLDEARARSAVPSAVVRVGQIAGPRRSEAGEWTRREWLPSLVRSSLHLGVLPADLGLMSAVDWVPIEDMAALMLEVAGVLPRREGWAAAAAGDRDGDEVEGYFNGVNPHAADWKVLAESVRRFYGPERIQKLVPLAEWVAALERSVAETGASEDSVAKNPAVKLLDFYQGLVEARGSAIKYDLARTVGISPTFARLEAVTPELMEKWCRQWAF